MSSAPIPTDGHRSKAAAIVYGVLAQAGPMHDLALACLAESGGHYGRASRLFMAQIGPKRHCAHGAAYSRSSVAKAMWKLTKGSNLV